MTPNDADTLTDEAPIEAAAPFVDAPEEPVIEAEAAPEEAAVEEAVDEDVVDETAEPIVDEEPVVDEEPAAPAEPVPADNKHWYIVKVQSNREDTIKAAIERQVKIKGLEEHFGQILVPVEKVSELRNGKRVVRARKMYPGYIMAYVEFNDRILYLFRETSGVGDFVGASVNRAPTPMPPREVERMLMSQQTSTGPGAEKIVVQVKIPFDKGDKIRVRDGTFAGMEGEVKEIMEPKDAKEVPRVRVELTIFGRPVPVEVEVWQVEQV